MKSLNQRLTDSMYLVIDNGTIVWGPSIIYDTGGPNSLALDSNGHCVETHVGTGILYYRVGNVDFANSTINWV